MVPVLNFDHCRSHPKYSSCHYHKCNGEFGQKVQRGEKEPEDRGDREQVKNQEQNSQQKLLSHNTNNVQGFKSKSTQIQLDNRAEGNSREGNVIRGKAGKPKEPDNGSRDPDKRVKTDNTVESNTLTNNNYSPDSDKPKDDSASTGPVYQSI